jgi:hypothetical protein
MMALCAPLRIPSGVSAGATGCLGERALRFEDEQ